MDNRNIVGNRYNPNGGGTLKDIHRQGDVHSIYGIVGCIASTPMGYEKDILVVQKAEGVTYLVRIRRITPRECWRLMGFSDADYDKAASVVSQSQLYKQAGNSIVKPVLMAIFGEML